MSVTKSFTVNVNSGIQTAYPGGIPSTIPGIINATYYDQGGEGISYHDLSPTNAGTGIRKEQGVDTEFRLPEGTIGGIQNAEWLEYTVDVPQDGKYDFEILFATTGRYGKFHIEVNGVDKTGIVSVLSTGSYSKFTAQKLNGIALNKGVQVIRIYFDFADYNMGSISVTKGIASGIEKSETQNKIRIFPIPARDQLVVSGISWTGKYAILNMYGQVQIQGNLIDNETINVSFLKSGNYLIRLISDHAVQIQKFIKL